MSAGVYGIGHLTFYGYSNRRSRCSVLGRLFRLRGVSSACRLPRAEEVKHPLYQECGGVRVTGRQRAVGEIALVTGVEKQSRVRPLLISAHGSGGRGGRPAACGPCPVQQHRGGGGEQRGPDSDQGDLPAGHSPHHHGVDLRALAAIVSENRSDLPDGQGLPPKFLVLEAVALVFGDRVRLAGFFSVTLLILALPLSRAAVRRLLRRPSGVQWARAKSQPSGSPSQQGDEVSGP